VLATLYRESVVAQEERRCARAAYLFGHIDRRRTSHYRGPMQTPLTVRRWQRAEYNRLVSLGMFQGEVLELIGGQLLVAEPQSPLHASAIAKADQALKAIVPSGWIVQIQSSVLLDDDSEPEPDLVVVSRPPGMRPTRPALGVEVSESSLEFDRLLKGSLYARAAIHDYWIVNLIERVVEVYREPAPNASAVFGWQYRSVARLAPPATVAPLAWRGEPVAVANLLP
jgi:Uma2 family endonuclease